MYTVEKEKQIKITELSNNRLMIIANLDYLDKRTKIDLKEEIQIILKLPKLKF
jgi:hypothetical protein